MGCSTEECCRRNGVKDCTSNTIQKFSASGVENMSNMLKVLESQNERKVQRHEPESFIGRPRLSLARVPSFRFRVLPSTTPLLSWRYNDNHVDIHVDILSVTLHRMKSRAPSCVVLRIYLAFKQNRYGDPATQAFVSKYLLTCLHSGESPTSYRSR